MSKYKCRCGKIVMEGEIEIIEGRRKFIALEKPNGAIMKNNSQNPENWDAICSACQKEKKEEKTK